MSLRPKRKRKPGSPPYMAREFPWLLQLFLQLGFVKVLRVITALLCNRHLTPNCLGRSPPIWILAAKIQIGGNYEFGIRFVNSYFFIHTSYFYLFNVLRISLSASRFFRISRLSYFFLPLAMPISTLSFRPALYTEIGIIVKPF